MVRQFDSPLVPAPRSLRPLRWQPHCRPAQRLPMHWRWQQLLARRTHQALQVQTPIKRRARLAAPTCSVISAMATRRCMREIDVLAISSSGIESRHPRARALAAASVPAALLGAMAADAA